MAPSSVLENNPLFNSAQTLEYSTNIHRVVLRLVVTIRFKHIMYDEFKTLEVKLLVTIVTLGCITFSKYTTLSKI